MKNFSNKFFSLLIFYVLFGHISNVSAKLGDWKNNLVSTQGEAAYQGGGAVSDVATYIGKLILMGPFLGIPFIIQIVLAGYEWMTAAGEAKKAEDAKKRITNAVIGLVLFISLYIMAVFIIKSLSVVTEYPV